MEFASFVLAAATADLTEEPAARAHAHAVEFRMDRATDPLDALAAYDGDLPLLATNRVASEGGEAPTRERRLAVLERAAEHSTVAAIDIELATVEKKETRVAEHAREHGTKVVVSVHDFAGTPSRAEMTDLLARAGEYGDIAKLAVTAESSEDVLDLLAVTREHEAAGHRWRRWRWARWENTRGQSRRSMVRKSATRRSIPRRRPHPVSTILPHSPDWSTRWDSAAAVWP